MYGSYIGQLIRIMLSIVWFGSQAWLGGLWVSASLSSWSYNFLTLKNTLPASADMVTRDCVGFVIFSGHFYSRVGEYIFLPILHDQLTDSLCQLIRVEKVALFVAMPISSPSLL